MKGLYVGRPAFAVIVAVSYPTSVAGAVKASAAVPVVAAKPAVANSDLTVPVNAAALSAALHAPARGCPAPPGKGKGPGSGSGNGPCKPVSRG